ncbi:MAG: hypothetical protein IKH78_03050 [Ruminococcus sp.]|nr:hypothetical protein [Ruminococcus sp.]
MTNIRYNEQEEAYELPYKLWDGLMTVRFYTEDEKAIIDRISEIAKKLARLDSGRSTVAWLLIDEGFYEGSDAEALAKLLRLRNVYVDIDDEETVVCFDTGTDDGFMQKDVHIELFGELFEITGWVE